MHASWSSKAGELGLLGATIPEEYGGLGLDQTSGVIIAETVGRGGGFGTTFGAQTSIGLLPILYFGSEELKKTWIPQIISGEVVTAYCLTESGSGSDALGAKTTARLTEDGQRLHSERREDVHLKRQFCRRLHRFCEGRWREGKVFGICRRAQRKLPPGK